MEHICEALINGVVVHYSYCSTYKEDDRFTTPEPGVKYIYLGQGVIHRVNYLGKEYDPGLWPEFIYFWEKIVTPKGEK